VKKGMKMAEDVKVPEGWKRVRLGEVAEILTGATPLREKGILG